jgi:MFS family permease
MSDSLNQSGTQSAGFLDLFRGNNLRPLTIGMSLMCLQQVTGQPSVLYYAAEIFRQAGFASGQESTGVSVFLGLFKLVATGVAVFSVDSVGRRPLLLAGVTGMTFALLALGGSSLTLTGSVATWTSVIALLVYVGAYQVSFGPISWLIVGEVFPLAVRGPASAVAALTNFGSNFAVSLVLPSLQDSIGPGFTYLVFAAVSVAAVAIIYSIVPETKGKTLEQIEAMWKK